MSDRDRSRSEVDTFHYNAKEGVRQVAFFWAFRKVLFPVSIVLLFVVGMAFANGGPLAGFISMVVFGGPMLSINWFSSDQFRKTWEYWTR